MRQYEIGMLVQSKSGHDQGTVYVIMDMQGEYLFLVDGTIKKMSNPKKKNKKHVQRIDYVLPEFMDLYQNDAIRDDYIKRQIKLFKKQETLS